MRFIDGLARFSDGSVLLLTIAELIRS